MNTIVITVHYELYGNRSLRSGEFKVNSRLFAQYPDLEAAKVAYKWIREIKRESGFEAIITKVLYDGKDITHLTNEPQGNKENELPF